jgi:hypothetical protein
MSEQCPRTETETARRITAATAVAVMPIKKCKMQHRYCCKSFHSHMALTSPDATPPKKDQRNKKEQSSKKQRMEDSAPGHPFSPLNATVTTSPDLRYATTLPLLARQRKPMLARVLTCARLIAFDGEKCAASACNR